MSKIEQAEYKMKACFQALLRRRRFSRQSLKDRAKQHRNLTLLGLDCSAKVEFYSSTEKNSSVEFSVERPQML